MGTWQLPWLGWVSQASALYSVLVVVGGCSSQLDKLNLWAHLGVKDSFSGLKDGPMGAHAH